MLRLLQKRTSLIKLLVPGPRLHQTIAQTAIKVNTRVVIYYDRMNRGRSRINI